MTRNEASSDVAETYAPVHPGEILLEELIEPHGLTAYALARELRMPKPRIYDIVRGERGISADTALRLARFFGNSAQFWLNLQSHYDLEVAEREVGGELDGIVQHQPQIG
jgi:addiction module HigA family antidote